MHNKDSPFFRPVPGQHEGEVAQSLQSEVQCSTITCTEIEGEMADGRPYMSSLQAHLHASPSLPAV